MIERPTFNLLTRIAFTGFTVLIFAVGQSDVKAQDANVENSPLSVELAADRLTQRFYETLDFGIIWRELAVSNAALRNREVDMTLLGLLYDSKARIPRSDRERAFVAQRNFNLLFSAVRFTAPEAFSSKEFEGKLKEPYESLTRIRPILSRRDWNNRVIRKFDKISNLLRQYIRSGADKTAAYEAEIEKLGENEPEDTERVRQAFHGVLSTRERVYVARREIHYLYFIEEGSDLRLLTIRSRRRF